MFHNAVSLFYQFPSSIMQFLHYCSSSLVLCHQFPSMFPCSMFR